MNHQQKQVNNVLLGVVIVLLSVIAVMGFFLGKMSVQTTTNNNTNTTTGVVEDVKITVYDDKRCRTCDTNGIVTQLKQIPALANAVFEMKDFSDKGVEDYLTKNDVKFLPAVVFNKNNVDPGLNPYLQALASEEFSLAVDAKFNPFAERSDKGFLVLDKEVLKQIKDSSYINGNTDAKITWVEYSDIECPFCAKLHTDGTPNDVTQKYGDDINIAFNHFPLDFHANAQIGAEILECLAEQKGSEAFYSVIESSFVDKDSGKDYLIEKAVEAGANQADLITCIDENRYTDKVKNQMALGASTFGVTGTPGNVLINNETGEFEVLSGAYPASSFYPIIDNLLK